MSPVQAAKHKKGLEKRTGKEEVLRKAVVRVLTFLEISRTEAARILGLSEASLSRVYGGTKTLDPDTKEGEVCLLLIRFFRSLDTLLGGDDAKMKAWFRAKNSYLGQSPAEAMQNIGGFVRVVTYLDAMRGKI